MRGLLFFPIPYPDECYYSIFCRYFARSGSTSNKRTIFELFGEAQSIATFVYFPRRLELLENWVGNNSLITRESIAGQNSCYAYFSTAFPDQMFQGMVRKIETGEANRGLERQIIQKCRHTYWPEFLRYCPDCVSNDIEKHGETYWHRLPQLKSHWKEWEQEQLNLLRNAYETIKETGDPDRRVTVGWLCTVAGLRECDIKGRLHRFPDLRAFIDAAIEGKEEWLTRRFMKIAEKKKQRGENLTLGDIKREMRLKPNTYKKYAVFIKEMIGKMS